MMRHMLVAAALCWVGATHAAPFKDQFLLTATAGDIAWVPEAVSSLLKSKTVVPMTRNATLAVDRRPMCIVAVAHRDLEQKDLDTFIGIQLIKVFSAHASPGVMYAIRNGIWYSRDTGQLLQDERSELSVKSTADFATAHGSSAALELLKFSDGRRNAATAWHARLAGAKDAAYSAEEQYIQFWRKDPLQEKLLRDAHPEAVKSDSPVRIENRLLRFSLTASGDPSRMPSFHFDCNDPSLTLVAIRLYMPFAGDEAWSYLKFNR